MSTPTYQHMNCSVVFNKTKDAVLFCKRMSDPYEGCLNFVGGKVEPGELSIDAAYRELQEETGITPKQIQLYHFMDITYYHQGFVLEMYTGILEDEVKLHEEKNPLLWLPLTEDFTDRDRFAGEQNIAHIINVALKYPIPSRDMMSDGRYIGIDGCSKGWIAVTLDYGQLRIKRYKTLSEIIDANPLPAMFLIDMPIGLPEKPEDIRPDSAARKELRERGSTIFPVPCRQAVHAAGQSIEASNIDKKESPGNDKDNFNECINKYDKFWYVIYEHETILDRFDENHEAARFREEYIAENENTESKKKKTKKKKDKYSYQDKMKKSVKFVKMYIIELNKINYKGVLKDFNQGKQKGGQSRKPKFKIPKRNIDNYIVFSETAEDIKKRLIISVILFFGAAVAFGISRWYYWRGGAVMDGPADFYSRMFRMYDLYLRISIGLLVAGAVSIALDFLLKIMRRS